MFNFPLPAPGNDASQLGPSQGAAPTDPLVQTIRTRFNALTPAQRKQVSGILSPQVIAAVRLLLGDAVADFLMLYHQKSSGPQLPKPFSLVPPARSR